MRSWGQTKNQLCWLGFFFVNLTQDMVIWEEGTSIEKTVLSNWFVSKSVVGISWLIVDMWGHHPGCCYSWLDGPVFFKFYKKWSWVSLYLGVTQSVMFFHNLCFSSSSQISAQISHEEGLWAGSQDRNQNNLSPPKLYGQLCGPGVYLSSQKQIKNSSKMRTHWLSSEED